MDVGDIYDHVELLWDNAWDLKFYGSVILWC